MTAQTILNQRQIEILLELQARYAKFAKNGQDYEVNGINFNFTTPTVYYVENGRIYDQLGYFYYQELEAIAKLTDVITYVENTNIAMFANEHVIIHASILDWVAPEYVPASRDEIEIDGMTFTYSQHNGYHVFFDAYNGETFRGRTLLAAKNRLKRAYAITEIDTDNLALLFQAFCLRQTMFYGIRDDDYVAILEGEIRLERKVGYVRVNESGINIQIHNAHFKDMGDARDFATRVDSLAITAHSINYHYEPVPDCNFVFFQPNPLGDPS